MFSGAHLHLLVNHAPLFGAIFALVLLVASFIWAPDVLRRTALAVLIFTALAAVVADLSGDPAEDAIRGFPGVQRAIIHEHEEFADKAYIAASIVGVLALIGLVRYRRAPLTRGVTYTALAGAAVVSGMMAYTGLLGGRIRHTEVRPGASAVDATVVEPPRAPGRARGPE
jgi:hypothetical protein